MAHDQPQQIDSWHRHTPDEGTPQPEHAARANPAVLGAVVTVLTIAFVATVIIIILYYNASLAATRAARLETSAPADEWFQYQTSAMERLRSYSLVDPENSDAVLIPIDIAQQRVIDAYARDRHSQGTP